jgi:hypothetical protein
MYLRQVEMPSLQSYLRLVNFHRRCIPMAAKILHPLTDDLRSSGILKITLTPSMESAFQVAKRAASNAATWPIQTSPPPSWFLTVDASDSHVEE